MNDQKFEESPNHERQKEINIVCCIHERKIEKYKNMIGK